MLLPIHERNTKVYTEEGSYLLMKKDGNQILYQFEDWNGKKQIEMKPIQELNKLLGVNLLWAVYEDI